MIIPEHTDHFVLRASDIRNRLNDLPATEKTYRKMINVLKRDNTEHNIERDISEREARHIIKIYQIPKEKRFNNLMKNYVNQRAKEKSNK